MITDVQRVIQQTKRVIEEERYDELKQLLPALAEAVTNESAHPSCEERLLESISFLRAAIALIRAQRTHHQSELLELKGRRAYLQSAIVSPALDVSG